jgi:hypothetical protein
MSRTAHHVPREHWNVKRLEYEHWRSWQSKPAEVPTYWNEVGHVLLDLRFYAGCKRMPAEIRKARWHYNYGSWGHFGAKAVQVIASKERRRTRAWERMFNQDVAKLHRADGDLDNILEPEGRTRHSAIWDAW